MVALTSYHVTAQTMLASFLFCHLLHLPGKCRNCVTLLQYLYCIILTLQTRSDLCTCRNETARPRSQFSRSCTVQCICERFIYFHDWSTFTLLQPNRRRFVGIYTVNRSLLHECRNWERGRAVSFLEIFVSNFRYNVFAVNTVPSTKNMYSRKPNCGTSVPSSSIMCLVRRYIIYERSYENLF